ncbi:MAG: permease, partial [Candidatus Rifleibacteriota bacterium]
MNIQQKSVWQQLEYIMPRFFLLVLVLVSLFGSRSTELRTFSLIFISILFEALPFMLLGSLAGGFIEEFVPRDKLTELMPSGSKKAVFLSALVGFIFPVCECAIVPVVRRLLRKGVPFSAAVAYLLAGPIVNPLVAASTAVAYFYNWKMVALRLGLGYLAAVSVGLIVNFLTSENNRLAHDSRSCQAGCSCGHDHEHEHDY